MGEEINKTKDECQFRSICTSIECDLCRCLGCAEECTFQDGNCSRDEKKQLRHVKMIQKVLDEIKYKNEHEMSISELDKKKYIIIIDSLDKQIPKDVANKNTEYVKFCPVCSGALLRENDKYCSDCGQKLKWN